MRSIAAAAVSAAIVFAGSSAGAQEPVEITFFMFAGSGSDTVPKEAIADYVTANPHVTINISETTNAIIYPQMVTARRTTPDSPLVHCGFFNADTVNRGDVDDMWEVLDRKNIPNMDNVLESYARPDDRGVAYQMMGVGILYNTNVMSEPPTSWADLWDEKNRGRVAMLDNDMRMIAVAARLNGGDEFNPDPGFKVWADNAQNLRALVESNDALKNLLVSGDAGMAPWWSSVSDFWIKEGAPLAFAVPKEGAIAFPIYMAIAKGVSDAQREVCESLLNELLTPARAGRYGSVTSSIPLVRDAVMSEDQVENPVLNPQIAEKAIILDFAHISSVASEWRERWARDVKLNMR